MHGLPAASALDVWIRDLQTRDMNTTSVSPVRKLLNTIHDELRKRHEAHVAYEALRRDLGSYSTAREVDDLLGVIRDQDGPEAQQIRDLLLDNQRPTTALSRVA